MMRSLALALAYLVFITAALAGDINVTRAIVVAPPGANAASVAAYFTVENKGAAAVQLTDVTTPIAAGAMLHENVDDNGVMKMLMLDKIDIPAGGKIEMKPAGLHVMLMGPKGPIKLGDTVPFELSFAGGAKLPVAAKVVPLSEALKP